MKRYSVDIRQRVIAAVARGGESQPRIARRLEVSLSYVEKSGEAASRNRTGDRPAARRRSGADLRRCGRCPADRGGERNARRHLGRTAGGGGHRLRHFHGLGSVPAAETDAKKKFPHADERDRPDVQQRRKNWRRAARRFGAKRLIFLDETAVNLDMARRYGRAPAGVRVAGSVPGGTPPATTLIAAMTCGKVLAPFAVRGAADATVFRTWVTKCLVPHLRPGDVVVMDNLSAHKDAAALAALRAAGAVPRFLPPYSPDMNAIEKLWSKLKTYLRKAAARTFDRLLAALGEALETVTPSDCHNWFGCCGYNTLIPKPL